MPRYGPPPSDDAPTPPANGDDKSSLTRWSLRAKILSVFTGILIVAAFVFEFLPPTSSDSSKQVSTTVATSATTTELSTTTLQSPTTGSFAPTTSVPTTTTR